MAFSELLSVLSKDAGRLEPVIDIDDSDSHIWLTFSAVYDHVTRRYYWLDDSGYSCNYFGDILGGLDDCYSGSRDDLIRAVREWHRRDNNPFGDLNVIDSVSKVKSFRPSNGFGAT